MGALAVLLLGYFRGIPVVGQGIGLAQLLPDSPARYRAAGNHNQGRGVLGAFAQGGRGLCNQIPGLGRRLDEIHHFPDGAGNIARFGKAGDHIALIDGIVQGGPPFQHSLGLVAIGAVVQGLRGTNSNHGTDAARAAGYRRIQFPAHYPFAVVNQGIRRGIFVLQNNRRPGGPGNQDVRLALGAAQGIPQFLLHRPIQPLGHRTDDAGNAPVQLRLL